MSGKKKFSFVSVILSVICVVFVCEAAAPAAAIGNQQFFWWIFLIITFLLPYGMVVAELGTTYDSEGGIYDWVRDRPRRQMGRPHQPVLLDQLPAVDRQPRHPVPAHFRHGVRGRYRVESAADLRHRDRVRVDRRVHELLEGVRPSGS